MVSWHDKRRRYSRLFLPTVEKIFLRSDFRLPGHRLPRQCHWRVIYLNLHNTYDDVPFTHHRIGTRVKMSCEPKRTDDSPSNNVNSILLPRLGVSRESPTFNIISERF